MLLTRKGNLHACGKNKNNVLGKTKDRTIVPLFNRINLKFLNNEKIIDFALG